MSEGYQSQQASILNYHRPAEEAKESSHSIVNSIGARDRILPSGPRALIPAREAISTRPLMYSLCGRLMK